MGLLIQEHIVKMYCANILCKIVWNSITEKKSYFLGILEDKSLE